MVRIGFAGSLTGAYTWGTEQHLRGVEKAVAHLNEAGGVLGKRLETIPADDFCDGPQGVAAANKLVADGLVFVSGHVCSGASIPASAVYADAGILMISPGSTNPVLTEQGSSAATINRASSPAATWRTVGPTSRSRSPTTANSTDKVWPRRPRRR
jgi:branched-chain amino acid transport system substrate-binding protein